MNKVRLETIYPADRGRYEIPLGNGTHHIFTNLKAAKAFLVATNHFLTQQVFTLTGVYTELYAKFRTEAYFSIEHYGHHTRILGMLGSIDNVLKNAIDRSVMKEGHHITFINLNKACRFSVELITLLKEHDKNKSNTINTYTFDSLIDRITHIQAGLTAYGRLTASYYSTYEYAEDQISVYRARPTVEDLITSKGKLKTA